MSKTRTTATPARYCLGMKTIVAPLAAALLALTGCSSSQDEPDLAPYIESVREAGDDMRACEVSPRSPDCRFAVRDATENNRDVWEAFNDAGLMDTMNGKAAYDLMSSWSTWEIRCDGGDMKHAVWCVTSAPSEDEADKVALLLTRAVDEGA